MRIIIIRKAKIVTNINHSFFPQSPFPMAREATEPHTRAPVNSTALLGTGNQLTIQHQGELYILRQTRAGKLILTK
jgi:hemin uptake protein HemP